MLRRKSTKSPTRTNLPPTNSDSDPDASDPSAYTTSNPLAPGPMSSSRPPTNGHPTHQPIHTSSSHPIPSPPYLPGGARSLSAISLRSVLLGATLSFSTSLSIQLALSNYYLWRIPFFTATLALFHYLEFDVTARFNPADAKVDSFLLTANGRGYNVAHACAVGECVLRTWLRSRGWELGWGGICFDWIPPHSALVLGFLLIVLGQVSRTLAMATAGPSFNHLVQSTKRDDHVLVTWGIYAWSRHPSYFGFFWWGLGTQLVLGNWVCFVGYAVVLWGFFRERIRGEEGFLERFFGEEYRRYRGKVRVGIPGIR